jgi:hypothetical protein
MRILLLTSALLIACCSQSASAAISHPTGPAKVVLRVSVGGGFVALQTNLRALPSFTLYGDGSVLVPGAVPQLSPGPALSPLVRRRLGERQVQALLQRARTAGLLAPGTVDYGNMGAVGVSDGPTTTFIANADGRHIVRSAYALGMGAGTHGLSPRQVKARAALARFVASLPRGPAGVRYVPRALAVYVTRAPAQAGSARVVWPLKRDLATAGKPSPIGGGYRCIAVGGSDAKKLMATLRTAGEQSAWIAHAHAGATYQVVVRPLLPDEHGCSVATP